MFIKDLLRPFLSPTNPLLLFYHKTMAVVAATWYGFPSRKLKVIGVTGTNGKTTVVNLITRILMENGSKVGMASTVNFQLGGTSWMNTTKMSTQSAFFIQRFLRDMVRAGCDYAVLEVTSHALTQSRVWGIDFDVALMTNVTGDHIEYHGGFENYLHAKGLLFRDLISSGRKVGVSKVTIVNRDDANFDFFDQFLADTKLTYGLTHGTCTAKQIEMSPEGTKFLLQVPNDQIEVNLRLPGIPNVYNVLAAACVALNERVPLKVLQRVLGKIDPVPGRYELVNEGQPFHVVVDYAHNIDAIGNILKMYKDILSAAGKGKLIVVFGATGGGRDQAKRPVMGALLDQYADTVIVTDDDPYEEDEWRIISMVSEGVKRQEGGVQKKFWKIPGRREAIRLAFSLARDHDIVLIAGKGAEPVQMVYGERRAWDDRAVARELLNAPTELAL